MADVGNSDRPRGMWPIRHLTGGEIRTNKYGLTAGSGQLLTRGDPLERLAAGTVDRAEASASSTDTIVGVAAGFSYKNASGSYFYSDQIPAARSSYSEMVAYVWDDPNIVFGIQADGSLAATAVHGGFNLIVGNGNTTTKLSICELDASPQITSTSISVSVSASAITLSVETLTGKEPQLKVLDKINTPDNAWGSQVDVEVVINKHAYKGAATLGV